MPIHRCSHALIDDLSDLDTDRYPVSELYKEFKGREDVMIIPHIGGRRATLDVFDEDLSPFIEIMSVHGHFQWFADEAMERHLKTGFIASSDTHSGRPGNTFPVSFIEAVKSGLTAVYAADLTRKSLWEAFKQRHVYGTTSARIILNFKLGQAMMGDVVQTETNPVFDVKVHGTAPLEHVEIFKAGKKLYSHPLQTNTNVKSGQVIIRWTGARTQFRRRNLDWSGEVTITNGQIEKVEPLAFDLDWEGITHTDEEMITFHSTTAGDYDGLHIWYSGDENTIIKFASELKSVEFNPGEVTSMKRYPVGLVEGALEIVPVYEEEPPLQASFTFEDTEFDGNPTAYYVRVHQVDGEKAWSSPIFINWED